MYRLISKADSVNTTSIPGSDLQNSLMADDEDRRWRCENKWQSQHHSIEVNY